jgi:hypothetical protein
VIFSLTVKGDVSPSLFSFPFKGEGDKAGSQENQRFFWVLKGERVDR